MQALRSPGDRPQTIDEAASDPSLQNANAIPGTETEQPVVEAAAARLLTAGALLAAVLLGYHFSITTLVSEYRQAGPFQYLIVPLSLGALITLGTVVFRPEHHQIEDRYLDHIVGLPLLLAAMAMQIVLPVSAAAGFWLSRLDLLSLPMFVAGAVSLLVGVRMVVKILPALGLLLLTWPPPALALMHSLGAGPSLSALGPILVVALLAIANPALAISKRAVFKVHHIPARSPRPSYGGIALVLGFGLVCSFANDSFQAFRPIANDFGMSRLEAANLMSPAVPGWTADKQVPHSWVRRYLGAGSDWSAYTYERTGNVIASAPRTSVPVSLDVISAAKSSAISDSDLTSLYHLRQPEVLYSTTVELGSGLTGRVITFRTQQGIFSALYWDLVIQTNQGPRYQRFIVTLRNPPQDLDGPDIREGPIRLLGLAVTDWLEGTSLTSTKQFDGTRRFLTAFGTAIVRSIVRAGTAMPAGTGASS